MNTPSRFVLGLVLVISSLFAVRLALGDKSLDEVLWDPMTTIWFTILALSGVLIYGLYLMIFSHPWMRNTRK